MVRRIAAVALLWGAFVGFGSGFASLLGFGSGHCHAQRHHHPHHHRADSPAIVDDAGEAR